MNEILGFNSTLALLKSGWILTRNYRPLYGDFDDFRVCNRLPENGGSVVRFSVCSVSGWNLLHSHFLKRIESPSQYEAYELDSDVLT